MKNWKDAPNLFANGEFYAKVNTHIMPIIGFADGHINMIHGDCFILRNQSKQHVYKFTSECTLIARKIEDMTGDEIDKLKAGDAPAVRMPKMILGVNFESYLTDDFLYLLSIGVYPFDQSHFEDGTVIDRATL